MSTTNATRRTLPAAAALAAVTALTTAFPTPATAAEAAGTAPTEATGPGLEIRLTPKPGLKLVHNTSIKTQSEVKSVDKSNKSAMIDVLTNTLRFESAESGFSGGIPLSATLVKTQAQAFARGMAPIQRMSPLKALEGGTAKFVVYPGGGMELTGVQLKGKASRSMQQGFKAVVQETLRPFNPPSGLVHVGDTFEHTRERQLPVHGAQIAIEILERYTVTAIEGNRVVMHTESVIRPRSRTQQQQVFGKGEGTIAYDGELGIVYFGEDRSVTEGRIRGDKGWVVFKAETETVNQIQIIGDQKAPPAPAQ